MIKYFGLLILRISIGAMLIHHGYEKLAKIKCKQGIIQKNYR